MEKMMLPQDNMSGMGELMLAFTVAFILLWVLAIAIGVDE